MAVAAGGVGLFLLLWAWFRSGSIFTVVLAVFGVALLGPGLIDRLAHSLIGVVATVLNGIGGAL